MYSDASIQKQGEITEETGQCIRYAALSAIFYSQRDRHLMLYSDYRYTTLPWSDNQDIEFGDLIPEFGLVLLLRHVYLVLGDQMADCGEEPR